MMAGQVQAQQPISSVPSSTPTTTAEQEDAVVSSRGSLNFDRQVAQPDNIGTQQAIVPNATSQPPYYGEVHNGKRIGGNTSQFFLEYKSVLGLSEIGKGVQAAYVPFRFGGYLGFMSTRYTKLVPIEAEYKWQYTVPDGYKSVLCQHSWFSLGGVLRLIERPRRLDCQLYGGILVGDGLGAEYGIRFAKATSSPFSWNSFSMGLMHTPEGTALSMGFGCVPLGTLGLIFSFILLPGMVTITF